MNNKELEKLYNAGQGERKVIKPYENDKEAWMKMYKNDQERKTKVQLLLDKDEVKTGTDYYNASMILQHGGNPEDFLKANELAKKAVELGEERSKWMVAASYDRYLTSTKQPFQKYGTQYRKIEGKWIFYPIDPATTDEERKLLNVPTLAEIKEKERKLNKEKNL